MKMLSRENFLENKYNRLLVIEFIIIVTFPILQIINTRFPIITLLLLIALAPALYVGLSRKAFLGIISLGIIVFVLNIFVNFKVEQLKDRVFLCLLILYAVFLLVAIIVLIRKMSSRKVVTADTIKGGISVYLLIGLFWTVLYLTVFTLNPSSFTNITDAKVDCFYYSFSTLTTLGYGDITPVNNHAKILAIIEAVTGPVYLAIFIAQLIGINITQKLRS